MRSSLDNSSRVVFRLVTTLVCLVELISTSAGADDATPRLSIQVSEHAPAGTVIATLPELAEVRGTNWLVVSSAPVGLLELDAASGELRVLDADRLDHESVSTVELVLSYELADDPSASARRAFINDLLASGSDREQVQSRFGLVRTLPVLVRLTDEPEPPNFSRPTTTAPRFNRVGPGAAWRYTAQDPDIGDDLQYAIIDGNAGDWFGIDGATGDLFVRRLPETASGGLPVRHDIVVSVTDADGLSATLELRPELTAITWPVAIMDDLVREPAGTTGSDAVEVTAPPVANDDMLAANLAAGAESNSVPTSSAELPLLAEQSNSDARMLPGLVEGRPAGSLSSTTMNPVRDSASVAETSVDVRPTTLVATSVAVTRSQVPPSRTSPSSHAAATRTEADTGVPAAKPAAPQSAGKHAADLVSIVYRGIALIFVLFVLPVSYYIYNRLFGTGAAPLEARITADLSESEMEADKSESLTAMKQRMLMDGAHFSTAVPSVQERRRTVRGEDLREMKAALLDRNPARKELEGEFVERRKSPRGGDLDELRKLSKSVAKIEFANASRDLQKRRWRRSVTALAVVSISIAALRFFLPVISFSHDQLAINCVLMICLGFTVVTFVRLRRGQSNVDHVIAVARSSLEA
ncbi:MAG: cadherin repeat domain-containing protein [Planctomycetaceae bacterium]